MTASAAKPRAPYVIVVGGEGAGKTTQLARLKEEIATLNLPFETVFTREPGGTTVGERIRAFVLTGDGASPEANALLFFADKAETAVRIVRPALANGNAVISDRGFIDTLVYNIQVEGLDRLEPMFWHMVDSLLNIPTLAVLLDVDTVGGLARRRSTGEVNRYDEQPDAYHVRINEAYRQFWKDQVAGWLNRPHLKDETYFKSVVRKLGDCRFVRIDANRDQDAVYADFKGTVEPHLQEYAGALDEYSWNNPKEASVD